MREETGSHLAYLDGWRGIAVLTVVAGHFLLDGNLWNQTSRFGVELFFVLSGRLMAEILFVRKAPLGTFVLRRFSRIYPALLAYVVIVSIAAFGSRFENGPVAALAALTFTLNYAMIYTHQVALLDHIWSLCVEEHSYIVLAGITLLTRRLRVAALGIVAAIGVGAFTNGVIQSDLFGRGYFEVFWRSDVAAAGIFLSGALWLKVRGRRVPAWIPVLAFASAILARAMPGALLSFGLATTLLAIAITTIESAPAIVLRALSDPVVTRIGVWSYSIYLWQQPFYKLNRDGAAPTWLLLCFAAGCALASFYAVERPARAFLNAHFQRWALARTAAR